MIDDKSKPNRDLSLLCPWFGHKVDNLVLELDAAGYPMAVFEAYRSPARQEWLYEQGRTRPGKKVTNAKPWQSFHQYALAIDIVFFDGRKWSWDGPWEKVHSIAENLGFDALSWEKPHLQITGGLTHQEAYRIAQNQGMLAVWSVVQQRTGF